MSTLPEYDPVPEPTALAAAAPPAWLALSSEELASAIVDVERFIGEHAVRMAAMRDELKARMLRSGAVILSHPDLEVTIETGKIRDARISELRALHALEAYHEDPDFRKAVDKFIYEFTPKPTWKTDFRHFRQLVKYGSAVTEILNRGVVETESEPTLKIKSKERAAKNVTPIADGVSC